MRLYGLANMLVLDVLAAATLCSVLAAIASGMVSRAGKSGLAAEVGANFPDAGYAAAMQGLMNNTRQSSLIFRWSPTSTQYTLLSKVGRRAETSKPDSWYIKHKGERIPIPEGLEGQCMLFGHHATFATIQAPSGEMLLKVVIGEHVFIKAENETPNTFVNVVIKNALGCKSAQQVTAPGLFLYGNADARDFFKQHFEPISKSLDVTGLLSVVKQGVQLGAYSGWSLRYNSQTYAEEGFAVVQYESWTSAREARRVQINADGTWLLFLQGERVPVSTALPVSLSASNVSEWKTVMEPLQLLPIKIDTEAGMDALLHTCIQLNHCGGVPNVERFQQYADARGVHAFGLSADGKTRVYKVERNDDNTLSKIHSVRCWKVVNDLVCVACALASNSLRAQAARFVKSGGEEKYADPSSKVPISRMAPGLAQMKYAAATQQLRSKAAAHLAAFNRVKSKFDEYSFVDLPRAQHEAFRAILDGVMAVQNPKIRVDGEECPSFALLLNEQVRRWPTGPSTQDGDAAKFQWNPLVVKWCLSVYNKSPAAYSAMADGGFLQLPHVRTLQRLVHKVQHHTGIVPEHFDQLANILRKSITGHCPAEAMLLLDEMSIQDGLIWRLKVKKDAKGKTVGTSEYELVGFTDEFDKFVPNSTDRGLSKKVLQFMVRGTFGDFCLPVAYHEYRDGSAERLQVFFWQVVRRLRHIGLHVHLAVLDGASENRKFIQAMVGGSGETFVTASTLNPYTGERFWFMSDPPHLIKKLRNAIYKKEEPGNRQLSLVLEDGLLHPVRWNHIRTVYNRDLESGHLRTLYKLTPRHVDPNNWDKMRVALACQVLSTTVAKKLIWEGGQNGCDYMGTATFCQKCNELFDALNSHDAVNQRTLEMPEGSICTAESLLAWFQKQERDVKDLRRQQWEQEGGDPKELKGVLERSWLNAKTMFDMALAVEGFAGYAKQMLAKYPDKWLYPGRFNQDPLENFFGHVRYKGRSNNNPNVVQYGQRCQQVLVAKDVSRDLVAVQGGNTSGAAAKRHKKRGKGRK